VIPAVFSQQPFHGGRSQAPTPADQFKSICSCRNGMQVCISSGVVCGCPIFPRVSGGTSDIGDVNRIRLRDLVWIIFGQQPPRGAHERLALASSSAPALRPTNINVALMSPTPKPVSSAPGGQLGTFYASHGPVPAIQPKAAALTSASFLRPPSSVLCPPSSGFATAAGWIERSRAGWRI